MKENNNKEKRYIVYMHTAPNNKKYIGITRQEKPEKRWGSNGCGYIGNEHFSRAISKYGWNNIKHEILYTGLTKEEAEQKEIELIAYYDSMNPDKGYNMTIGGSYNVNVVLKPVKQYNIDGMFIKEYESIKYAALETGISKSSISLCCNNKLKTAGNFIWRFSDVELTQEYLDWCNSDNRKENRIAVCQYSKDGELICKYESLTAAGIETNIDFCLIIMCCKNEYKTAGGFIWRYANEPLTKEHLDWCNEPIGKEVSQYLKDGTFVHKYGSIEEAHLKTGVSRCGIGACCRGEYKTSGNYLWRFSNEKITPEYIEWCNSIEPCKEKRVKTAVIQYTTDGFFIAMYESLNKAERAISVSHKSISEVCKGKRESAGGFVWRYASDIQDPTSPLFLDNNKENNNNVENENENEN